MAERIVLHVGTPKSGTTYLQTVMWANRDRLAEAGLLVPGTRPYDHQRVARLLRKSQPPASALASWRAMKRSIREWDGDAVLSSEWLSLVGPRRAGVLVERLAPAEVSVVVTARDMVKSVPSAWQEMLKLGRAMSLTDFIEMLDAPNHSRWRWQALDPALAVQSWTPWVPAERVSVVTANSEGRDLLWRRFEQALGVTAPDLDLSPAVTNESLGAESVRLLELGGLRIRDAMDADAIGWYRVYRWMRDYLSHEVLAPRGGSPIGMTDEDRAAVRVRAEQSVQTLREAGFPVFGDLTDLLDGRPPPGAVVPADLEDSAVLDASLDVIAELLAALQRQGERGDALQQEVERLSEQLADSSTHDPLTLRARRLVSAIRVRRR